MSLAWLLTWPVMAGGNTLPSDFKPAAGIPASERSVADQAIKPGRLALSRSEADALILPGPGPFLELPSFDRHLGHDGPPLRFYPVRLFAPGARLYVVTDAAVIERRREVRQFYLASGETTGVGLSVDPASGAISGFAARGGSRVVISGNVAGSVDIAEVVDAEDNRCGTEMADQPIEALDESSAPIAPSMSAAAPGATLTYEAVVAVETDSEWLDQFNDDTNEAMSWITDAFLAMNVFFERDVETRVLIGDVMLRTDSDPYSVSGSRLGQLNEFGAWWKDNMGNVERQFAAMFSGRNISAGGFSGIAWINQYCAYGRTWSGNTSGSYSYNAIGSARTPGNTALFIGHELGHNMGSRHTHCYNPPVDQCYNAEDGCFDGDPVCPASGQGTIMSYCHVRPDAGAGCGTSNSEFHPVVQGLLEGRLADELAAGCILPYSDYTPAPGFEATPPAGALLDFGDHPIGTTTAALGVRVENIGDADLAFGCGLSGIDASAFTVESCDSPLTPAASTMVNVRCTPSAVGPLTAVLEFDTNDEDEPAPSWLLACSGREPDPPNPDIIFDSDFETPLN